MRLRIALLMLGAIALAQPPVPAEAHVLTIPVCGGGKAKHVVIPGDPADPAEERGCTKACHAITDRRSKHCGDKSRCCG